MNKMIKSLQLANSKILHVSDEKNSAAVAPGFTLIE